MSEIDNIVGQMRLLSDEDLIIYYGAAAKALKERGKLFLCSKELQRIRTASKHQEYPTIESDRGKVKRIPSHSILIDFLNEDWTFLFTGSYSDCRDYYVYYHSDPTKPNMRFRKADKHVDFNGRPFYVGKGTKDRYKSLLRSRSHLSIIDNLKSEGFRDKDIFHIFMDNLTELQAIELEAKLITFFGCVGEIDRNRAHFHGMKGGLLINSDPAKRPGCVNKMMHIKGS